MPKNAVSKTWGLRASLDGFKYSKWPAGQDLYEPPPLNGLIFALNNAAGSNCAIDWATGWPRFEHTSIWKARYAQQSGFYAWEWDVFPDNAWHSGTGEFGCHPYPTDGNFDAGGLSIGSSSSGTVHYFELANGFDKICDPPTPPKLVVKNVWYTQARSCTTDGSDYLHTFWPDVVNDPGFSITWRVATASLGTPTMKYRNGCSPWLNDGTPNNGTTSEETPGGTFRFFLKYSRALSIAEIQDKAGRTTDDTTDPDRWYSNVNPTPTDISDKSGMGNNPSWANVNRPTLYAG